MSRSHSNQSSAVLPAAIILLVLTTLAPTGATAWITAFRGPFMAFIAPISHPGSWLSRRLRPPQSIETPIDLATREQLESELQELATLHSRLVAENGTLRELIRQLQSGVPYEDRSRFRQVLATRTGYNSSGLIELRPGALKGISTGSVLLDGTTMQFVGTITTVGPTTCSARPITDPRITPTKLRGIVLPDGPVTPEILSSSIRCDFVPTRKGELVASVGADPYADLPVRIGMIVRLDDPAWPDTARMLVLGRVKDVRKTDSPLHVEVIVAPLSDPTRLRDLVIRIDEPAQQAGSEGGP